MSINKTYYIFGLLLCCAFSCTERVQPEYSANAGSGSQSEDCFVPSTLMVEFSDSVASSLVKTKSTGNSELEAAFDRLGVLSLERVFPDAGEFEQRHREAGLHKFYYLKYDQSAGTLTKAGADLSAEKGVVSAEPLRKAVRMETSFFNDPYLYRQWHYINEGDGSQYKQGADINVLPVWEQYTAGSSEVIVAVIDGGVDMNHEDLAGVVIPAGVGGSKNFFYDNYTVTPESHGTHVAGTIAAINNNGKGLCGIAGGKDGKGGVRILSCQCGVEDEEYMKGMPSAIVYAADNGAVICQNSWGTEYKTESEALNDYIDSSTKAAVDYFIKNAGTDLNGKQTGPMKGGVVIFAAGNSNFRKGWPAAYEPVVAVGAFSSKGTKSSYSNYGDWVDIAAPGGDANIGPQIFSTTPNSTYSLMQGTSMACPHVSGVAALLVSYYGGENFTNNMLIERLLGGADKEFLSSSTIGPKLDAYGSFRYGRTLPPEKVEEYAIDGRGGSIKFDWTVGEDEEHIPAYAYMLLASEDASAFDDIQFNSLPSNVHSARVFVGDLKKGDHISGFLRGLKDNTSYYTAITGYDYGRSYSELSEVQSVQTTENIAPAITFAPGNSISVSATKSLQVNYSVADADGDPVTVVIENLGELNTLKNAQLGENEYQLSINALLEKSGSYNIRCTATDDRGNASSEILTIIVQENHSPVVVSEIPDILFSRIGETRELSIVDYVEDPDGDEFSFEISHSSPQTAHLFALSGNMTLTALDYGLDVISLDVIDPKGERASLSFKVAVRSEDAAADVYPSQVRDYLKVSGGASSNTEVFIYNSAGTLRYHEVLMSSIFEPAQIDMSSYAPGVYVVKVSIDGKLTEKTIVKL